MDSKDELDLKAQELIKEARSRVTELDEPAKLLLFKAARSFNGWKENTVSDDQLREVYDLLKLCPTSANVCPIRIKFIRSKTAKRLLQPILLEANRAKTMDAPVVAILGNDHAFFEQPVLQHLFGQGFFQRAGLGTEPLHLMAGRLARRVAGKALLAGLQKLLRPAVIQALGDTLAAAQLSYALLTAQAFEHDADLLFRRELPSRATTDLADCGFCRLLLSAGHLDTLLGGHGPWKCLLAQGPCVSEFC